MERSIPSFLHEGVQGLHGRVLDVGRECPALASEKVQQASHCPRMPAGGNGPRANSRPWCVARDGTAGVHGVHGKIPA